LSGKVKVAVRILSAAAFPFSNLLTPCYSLRAAWPFGAAVAKLAYAAGLKSAGVFPVAGSSPASRTSLSSYRNPKSLALAVRQFRNQMRITVSHNRTQQEVVDSINRSFDELFSAGLPVKVAVQQKEWQGSTLNFALTAKMGMLSTPIKGTVEVTDHDLTVDADLGMLNNFISEKSAQDMIGTRIKGLLK
jgi:hypothetical protein